MQNLLKSKKFILLLFGFIILATGILIAIILIRQPEPGALVTISVAPQNAQIQINDALYNNNSSVHLSPGNYTANISLNGYEPTTIDFSLTKNGAYNLSTALLPENGDFSIYKTNYDNLYNLRLFSSQNPDNSTVKSFLETYDKEASIESVLPLYSMNPVYYIFFSTNNEECKRLYCLEIGADTDEQYNTALNRIREAGFNPDNYQLIQIRSTSHL